MSNPWFTFGVVRQRWRFTEIPLPYEFGPGVRLMLIPKWIHESVDHDPMRSKVVESLDHEQLCIGVDYTADALGSPDKSWEGISQRDLQARATERIHRVVLALWLVRRASAGGDVIVDSNNMAGEWITRRLGEHDAMLTMPPYEQVEFTFDDFEQAKALYTAMEAMPQEGTVPRVVDTVMRALTEPTFPIRHIMLWLAVEGLFGPDDSREISYRLSMRVAFFLEGRLGKARELFNQTKDSYNWRSKLVHGLRVKEMKTGEPEKLLMGLEDTVLRSLVKILLSDELRQTFNTNAREKYLDEVVFDGN